MSKLSFRARALDATKPMPVYLIEEVPDLPDFAAINRAVPQMPTGMEKEEECEHHLQRAISAQQAYGHTGELVIPTPEVYEVPKEFLQMLYPSPYKHPRQLIHVQPFSMDQDIPEYDMDSEDEKWLSEQAEKMDIKPLQFEQMMDRLENSSGQQVVTLKEAKLLLKEDDDLLIAVYDYWLNKRLRTAHPLIPQVKTEKRDGSTNNNPYVAFRRRTEKMQTRKNRKNDEASYEKMLKLKRDLIRASSLLEMIRKREKIKREFLHLTVEIFEKRYQAADFSGQLLAEVMAMKFTRPPVIPAQKPPVIPKPEIRIPSRKPVKTNAQKKRSYKRKTKSENASSRSATHRADLGFGDVGSSDEEGFSPPPSDQDDENDPDGPYAFKRKKNCNYHAPLERLGNYPWCSKEENGLADRRFRFCLTSVPAYNRQRCVGFARRRVGRGGRILFDRAFTPLDDCWSELDSVSTNLPNGLPNCNEFLTEVKNEWKWFRPQPHGNDSSSSRLDQKESESDDGDDVVHRRNCDSVNRFLNKIPIDLNRNVQCSQEELFEMQRKQLERLKADESSSSDSLIGAGHSFSSQPTSKFTFNSHQVQFSLPSVIATSMDSNSCPDSPTQNTSAVPDSNSIRSSHDRQALTNGPVPAEESDIIIFNNHNNFDKLLKEFYELNRNSSNTDVKPNTDVLQVHAQTANFTWPAVPSTTDHGVGAGSHPSASRHVIPSKAFAAAAAAQPEFRFISVEQNGSDGRVKKELFLSKVKVEKVNDSSVSMDVT